MSNKSDLKNRVSQCRRARGWSQQELAARSGVARATISAIEIQRLVPSTTAALALARALGCRVEDLFQIDAPAEDGPQWAWPPPAGPCRYWQAEVRGRTLLYPYEFTPLGAVEHDGVATDGEPEPRARSCPPTLVMACCDPAVGLLAAELASTAGVRLLALLRSSRQAIELLKRGLVHVAGCHLGRAEGDGNAPILKAELGGGHCLVRVVDWEEGVATNSERSSVGALVDARPRWVGREPGSGARQCLDELLGASAKIRRLARDHRSVAEAVRSGWADAGVCLRIAAEEAGLRFLPVRTEAYDLCFPHAVRDDMRVRALVRVLQSGPLRQVLGDVPGYRSTRTGATISTS